MFWKSLDLFTGNEVRLLIDGSVSQGKLMLSKDLLALFFSTITTAVTVYVVRLLLSQTLEYFFCSSSHRPWSISPVVPLADPGVFLL
jgi:hypothetical protein